MNKSWTSHRIVTLIDSMSHLVISDSYTRPVSDLNQWDRYLTQLANAIDTYIDDNPRKSTMKPLMISLKQECTGSRMRSMLSVLKGYIKDG